MAYKRKMNEEMKKEYSMEHLRPIHQDNEQTGPRAKGGRKRRDKSVKNAHIKIYNQAKQPPPSKHGKKNSVTSWDSAPGKIPKKTAHTIATSDDVSEQLKRLTRRESEENEENQAETSNVQT